MKPDDLLYAETHEWVKITADGNQKIATVGITDFAVHQLTDLVFMQLPPVGKELKAGQEFGEVESVKAVSPMYSPVSGKVIAVNEELPKKLEILGSDPFGQGWMLRIVLTSETELAKLLNKAAYDQQCATEG